MSEPTDPRVEAAARAILRTDDPWREWDKESDWLRGAMTDLATAALKAADEAAWLPIEAAPLHQEIIIAWKTGTVSVGTKYGTGWKFSNGDEMYGVHAALGWQPLPKSP